MTYDEERVDSIIMDLEYEKIGRDNAIEQLVELLTNVRAETVGWTWAEACSQYDKGLNVKEQDVPKLMEKAVADLNPTRE